MYVYKRGSVWWCEVTRNGVRHRASCGTSRKQDAIKFAERMGMVLKVGDRERALAMVDVFFPPEKKSGLPLDCIWDEYYKVAGATGRLNLADTTIRYRQSVVERFTAWVGKKCPAVESVEDVSGPIAAKYASDLILEKNQKGKPLSGKTRKNIIGELSTVWKSLEKASSGIRNPWSNLAPRDIEENRKEPFSVVQEKAIFKAAKEIGKDWYLACMIARHTGLRYGDVAMLQWSEVNLDKGVIAKVPSKTRRHKVEVVIPLVPELKDALLAAEKCRKGDFVLPLHAELYPKGKVAYEILNFREVLNAAAVIGEQFTFHSWRHTLRTRLAEGGASIEVAKRLLGHTNDEMSLHYDHSSHVEESLKALMAAR